MFPCEEPECWGQDNLVVGHTCVSSGAQECVSSSKSYKPSEFGVQIVNKIHQMIDSDQFTH